MKAWFLKLHRWVALLFALPLLVVIGTGLVLSFEPMVVAGGMRGKPIDAARIEQLLAQYDPQGKARAISVRNYDHALAIGERRDTGLVVDIASGQVVKDDNALFNLMIKARRLHQTMMLDLGWLVIASTYATLVLALLGVLLGWPRLRNTLAGWHKGAAWFLLPLLVLSPLTGLGVAHRITFAAPPGAELPATTLKLTEAVRAVGQKHDLSGLIWIRVRDGRMLTRLLEDGEFKVYAVTREGTVATQRNWPRLMHEGHWGGVVGSLINVVISLAMLGLLVTGTLIWSRRKLRRRTSRLRSSALAGQSG